MKKRANFVLPVAIIYTFAYLVLFVIGLAFCIQKKIGTLYFVEIATSGAIIFIILWSLSNAIDRIKELEDKISELEDNNKK